jgi:hypothetical protein
MIMISRLQTLCLFIWLVCAKSQQQQVCVQNPGHETDLCVAFASHTNTSSDDKDLYLRMSARFNNRAGWAAFGWGAAMSGSLMFTMYSGAQDGGMHSQLITQSCSLTTAIDVTVGVRSSLYLNLSF